MKIAKGVIEFEYNKESDGDHIYVTNHNIEGDLSFKIHVLNNLSVYIQNHRDKYAEIKKFYKGY